MNLDVPTDEAAMRAEEYDPRKFWGFDLMFQFPWDTMESNKQVTHPAVLTLLLEIVSQQQQQRLVQHSHCGLPGTNVQYEQNEQG